MATYALTVSTNALGLGVISTATVVVERKRTTARYHTFLIILISVRLLGSRL